MVRVILAVAVLLVPPLAECFDVGGATVHCVAVYLRRAFLCAGGRLLEASWPDVPAHAARPFAPAYSRATPSNMEHCAAPIAPIAAEVEAARGRLWVLDAGDDRCAPQVFVYDVRLNKEVWRCPLEDVPSGAVRALAVDVEAPVGGEVGGGGGVRAYVGDSGRGGLVVVALRERRFWFLDVHAPCEPGGVHALALAIARRPVLPALRTAHALPWAECLFLLDPAGDELLALDLATERARPPPPVYDRRPEAVRCEARCVGRLLGSPAAMAFDFRQGLHYFLNRDAAALRWDARRPLQAEAHQVLMQDADILPSVRQYFMDSQRNVWALIGTSEPETEDNEIDYAHAAEHTNKYPNTISHSRNPSYSQPPHSAYPVHSQDTLATPSESPPNTPDLTPSSRYSSDSVQGISSDSLTPHSGYLYDSPSPSTYPIINTGSSKYPPASPPLYPPQTPPIISPDATYSPPNTLPSPPASPASPSSSYSPNIYSHAVQNIPPSSPFSPPIVPPLEFQPPTDAPPAVIYSPLDVPPAVPTGRRLTAAARHAPAARGRPLQAKGSAGAEGRAWKRGGQSGDYEDDECHVMNARSNCFSVPNDLLFIQANAKRDPAGGSAGQLVRQPEVQSPSTSGFVVSRPADALPPPPPLGDPPPLPPPPPPPAPLTGNPQDPDPPRTLFNQLTAPLPALAPNPSLTRSARQLSGETVVGSVVTESAHAIPDATQGTIVVQEDMGYIHGNVIGAQQRSMESVDFREEPINESGLPPLSTQHSNDYVGKARSEREIVGGEQNSVDGKHTAQKGVEKMMGQDVNEERLNDSIENVGSAKENDEESIIEMIQELRNNGENNMETITVDKEKINNDEKGRLANPEYGKTKSTDHIFVDPLYESNTTNNQEKIKRVQEMVEDTDDGMDVQENFKNNNENIESKHVIIIDNQEQLNNNRDVVKSNIEHDNSDYSQKIQDTNSKASKKTEQLLPTTVSLLPTIERYELKNSDKSELLGDRNQLEGMKITNVDLEDKDVSKEVKGDFPVNEQKKSELMKGKQKPTRGVEINQNDKSKIENIIEKQTNNKHQLSPSNVNQAHHSLEREQRSVSDRASKDVHLYPENISTAKAINVPEQTVSCDSQNTKNKEKFTNNTSEDDLKEISGGERLTLDSKSESIALDDALHGQLGNECEREFKDHVKRQANSNKKSYLTHHLHDETHTYSENNDNSNINMFGNFEEQNKPQGHFILHISDETKANIYNKPTKSGNNDIKSQKPTVGTFTTQETLTKSDYFERDIKERNNDMRSEEIKEKHNKPLDSIVKTASCEIKCEKVPNEKLCKPYEEMKEEETLLERNKREKNFSEKEADSIVKEANKIKSHLVNLTPIPDTQINIVEQLEEGNTLKESTPSKDVFSEDRMEGVRPALLENGNTNYAVEKLNNKNNYKEIENMQHFTENREDNEMKVETKSVPNETFTLNDVGHDQGSKNEFKEVNGASNPSADTKDEYISSGSKPYNLGENISYKTSDTENMMNIDESFDDFGKTLVSGNLNTYYSKDQLQEEGTNENFKTTRDIALINNDKQTSLEPSNYSKENNREISSSDTLRKGAENIKNIFEQDIDSLDHSLPRIYRHLNSAELIPSDTLWGPDQLAEKKIDERYQESLKQAEEPLYINKHPQTTINHTNNIHVLSKKEKKNTQRNTPAANTGINVDEHHIESKATKDDTCYISNSFTKETREPLDNELNRQSIKENISIKQDNVNKPPEESYTIKKFQPVSDRVDTSPYITHNVNEEVDPVISIPSVISVENVPMNAFQILIPPDYSQKSLESLENSNDELQKEINLRSQNPELLSDKSSEIFSLKNTEVNTIERSHITSPPEDLSLQRPFNEVKTYQSLSSADLEWVVTGTVRPEHGVCASLPQCKAHSPRNMGKPPKLYSKKPETTEKMIKEILNSPENGGINDQPRVREIIGNSQEGDANNPKMTEDINLGIRFYSSLAQIAEEILDKTKEKVANNNDASKINTHVSSNLNIPSVFELISTTQTTQGENKNLRHIPLQNFDVLDEELQNNINKENILERNIIFKESGKNVELKNSDNENNHRMKMSDWQQRKPSSEEGRNKKIEEKIDEILPKEKDFPKELFIFDENSRERIEISEVQNKMEGEDGRRYFERTTEKSSEKEEVVPQNKEDKKVTKSKSTHFHGRKMLENKEQEQDFCFPDEVLKRRKVLMYNSNAEKEIKKNDNEASCVTHLDQVSSSNENDYMNLEKNKKELEEKAHTHNTCLIKSAFHEASNENLKFGSEQKICLNQFESPSPSTKTDTFTNHGDLLSSSQMTALRALKRIDPSVRGDSYSNAKHTDYEMNEKNFSKSKTHNSSNASFDDNGGLHHEAIHRIENEYVDYKKPRVDNITRENTEKEEQNGNEENKGTMHKIKNGGGNSDDDNESSEKENSGNEISSTHSKQPIVLNIFANYKVPKPEHRKLKSLLLPGLKPEFFEEEEEEELGTFDDFTTDPIELHVYINTFPPVKVVREPLIPQMIEKVSGTEFEIFDEEQLFRDSSGKAETKLSLPSDTADLKFPQSVPEVNVIVSEVSAADSLVPVQLYVPQDSGEQLRRTRRGVAGPPPLPLQYLSPPQGTTALRPPFMSHLLLAQLLTQKAAKNSTWQKHCVLVQKFSYLP